MSETQSAVYIIDDDPAMRSAIESLVSAVGLEARSYESPQAFLASARLDLPACLVLDVRMPEHSGLEFQQEMIAAGTEIPTVFITGHGDIPMSVSAMKAGAIEFLTKPFRQQELLDAVHRGIRLDRQRRKDAAIVAGLREREDSLTPREREVMALVATGKMNKQIAAELGLSEMTVKVHRAHVMRKMQATSIADLVRMADRLADLTTRA